jgi:hypothetical protein
VSFESAVYRLVAEPANPNCDTDCDRPLNLPRSLTAIWSSLSWLAREQHNRPNSRLQYRTRSGAMIRRRLGHLHAARLARMLPLGRHDPPRSRSWLCAPECTRRAALVLTHRRDAPSRPLGCHAAHIICTPDADRRVRGSATNSRIRRSRIYLRTPVHPEWNVLDRPTLVYAAAMKFIFVIKFCRRAGSAPARSSEAYASNSVITAE